MNAQEERSIHLHHALLNKEQICSSEGWLSAFPEVLKQPFMMCGVGIIVCKRGSFHFSINQKPYVAESGETLFIPDDSTFQILKESSDMEVCMLFYQIEPIRDIIGNAIISMHLYALLATEPHYVWNTGDEEEVLKYMSLLDSTLQMEDNIFNHEEQKLLLLGLTHRLCSVYNRKLVNSKAAVGHRHNLFIHLIELIETHYTEQRGVEFYADKLCLSPKYLSALSKSICGYTVQELVFKAIVRKSISLLKNTQKSIQEISEYFNFPNASYFGTFFKKQTEMSPQQYRQQ